MIAAVIAVTALGILRNSLDVLCDKAVIDTHQVEQITRGIAGVRDCHEVRTRGRTDNIYVDLHVLVDPVMTVLESHRLANLIESKLRQGFPGIHDVVVHIEPVSHGHEELEEKPV